MQDKINEAKKCLESCSCRSCDVNFVVCKGDCFHGRAWAAKYKQPLVESDVWGFIQEYLGYFKQISEIRKQIMWLADDYNDLVKNIGEDNAKQLIGTNASRLQEVANLTNELAERLKPKNSEIKQVSVFEDREN